MRKQFLYFTILLSTVLIGFNSCTIKKRLYEPGYHIDWNKKNKNTELFTKKETLQSNAINYNEEVFVDNHRDIIEESNQAEKNQEFESVYASSDVQADNIDITNSNSKKVATPKYSVTHEKSKTPHKLRNQTRTEYQTAKIGFILSILALITPFVGYLFPTMMFVQISILILSFGFAVAGLIVCIIAIKRMQKTDKWEGKKLAEAGKIISGVLIFIAILFAALMGWVCLLLC